MHVAAGLLLVASLAFAEDVKAVPLIHTLPADGAWSTFQVTVDTQGRSVPFTWTIRSVGQVMYDGKPCRCLEMEQVVENAPQEIIVYNLDNVTWRLIIPEEEFGEGKNPLARAVKTWQQIKSNDPVPQPSLAAADPLFAAILQGPGGTLKPEKDAEKIQWQRGELECQVLAGSQEIDFTGAKLTVTSRTLRHRDVPFSTAGTRVELKTTVGGADYVVRIKATLRDHGKDAKPKLPQLVP